MPTPGWLARSAGLVLLSLVDGTLGQSCSTAPDRSATCRDLGEFCATVFCPLCERPGYCDTTCGFCAPTTTTTTTRTTTSTLTTTRRPLTCPSRNSRTDAWCEEANADCETCGSPDLCSVLFCPTCPRAHECDWTCGFCSPTSTSTSTTSTSTSTRSSSTSTSTTSSSTSTTTATSTTSSSTSTTTTTTQTVTSSTSTTTKTTTSTSTGSTTTSTTSRSSTSTITAWASMPIRTSGTLGCYNSDRGALDQRGRSCDQYTSEMCLSSMDGGGLNDFSASEMCCACGGGVRACVDTDISSTDKLGRHCKIYTSAMCNDGMDDSDFDAVLMCCACGGGARPATTTTTTIATRLPPGMDQPLVAGLMLLWLLVIPVLLFALCLGIRCYRCRRPPPTQPADGKACTGPPGSCVIVDHKVTPQVAAMTMADRSAQLDVGARAAAGGRIVMRDVFTEATMYATACELFTRPELARVEGRLADADCVWTPCCPQPGPLRRPGPPVSINGPWFVRGRRDVVATISGTVVVVDSPAGRQEFRIATLPDGRLVLEVGDALFQGELVGDRLIWANGDTWRRTVPQATRGGLLVPARVIDDPTRGRVAGGSPVAVVAGARCTPTGGSGGSSGSGGSGGSDGSGGYGRGQVAAGAAGARAGCQHPTSPTCAESGGVPPDRSPRPRDTPGDPGAVGDPTMYVWSRALSRAAAARARAAAGIVGYGGSGGFGGLLVPARVLDAPTRGHVAGGSTGAAAAGAHCTPRDTTGDSSASGDPTMCVWSRAFSRAAAARSRAAADGGGDGGGVVDPEGIVLEERRSGSTALSGPPVRPRSVPAGAGASE